MTNARTASPLRCIAVDDEPFALQLIADDIAKVPFLLLESCCSSAMDALAILQSKPIDLIFLDIQMPGLTGTQFLRGLENPPMVIFTTAYEQYAVEGFELNVIDYLMKPIPFERFMKAVNKAWIQSKARLEGLAPAGTRGYFFVHSEYKEIKIPFEDVLYIEGLKDYVKIFLTSQSMPILTRLNLKSIETRLPADLFCRIHNSFIVSLLRIESFQRTQVFIRKKAIPIGDKYAAEFRTRYTSTH